MASNNDHLSTDEKFEIFLKNRDAFTVSITKDVDLYFRAVNWDVYYLKLKFLQDMRERSIESQCEFVNKVPLENERDENNRVNPILNYLLDLISVAPTAVLRKLDINPAVSPAHNDLHDYLQDMLQIRNSMCQIDQTYHSPHVALSLRHSEGDFCFVKYFNGSKWCKLRLNENIRSYISDLTVKKYTVLGNDLWFIQNDTLHKMNLFREKDFQSYILPKHTFQDIQLCNDGENLILLSKDMCVAEVYSVKYSETKFKVSKWYRLEPNEYTTVSSTRDYELYDIFLRKLKRKFKACFVKSSEVFCSFSKGQIYKYRFEDSRFIQNHYDVVIPKSKSYNCVYVLVPVDIIEPFLYVMLKNDRDHKRKYADTNSYILSNTDIKKRRVMTLCCQTRDEKNNQDVSECIELSQLTI